MPTPTRNRKGEWTGSIGNGNVAVPTSDPRAKNLLAADGTVEPPVVQEVRLADGKGSGEMLSLGQDDGPKGAGAPALAIEVKGGGRLYVPNPDDFDYAKEHPDAALEEGKAYPSITTCIGVLDKPALVPWATKMAGESAADRMRAVRACLDRGTPEGDAAARKLVDDQLAPISARDPRPLIQKEVGSAHRQKRDAAAERGTNVHAIVEEIERGGNPTIPEEAKGYLSAYEKYRNDFPDMKVVAAEVTVINEDVGYCGTIDAIAELPVKNADGTTSTKRMVLDYKTNKNGAIYDTVGLQLAAGAGATHVLHADGTREPMPEIHGGFGVGLSPTGEYTVRPFRTSEHFEAFSGTVRTWRGKRRTEVDYRRVPKANSAEELLNYLG